jgi:hypothetical protein
MFRNQMQDCRNCVSAVKKGETNAYLTTLAHFVSRIAIESSITCIHIVPHDLVYVFVGEGTA